MEITNYSTIRAATFAETIYILHFTQNNVSAYVEKVEFKVKLNCLYVNTLNNKLYCPFGPQKTILHRIIREFTKNMYVSSQNITCKP